MQIQMWALRVWPWSWTWTFEELQHFGRCSVFCSKALQQTDSATNSSGCWCWAQEETFLSADLSGSAQKNAAKNHPLPTILPGEREEKQQDGEKGEDEREQRRAAGFTSSLLSLLLSVRACVCVCVCVWQVLSLLPSMLWGSVRSEVVGGHFLSISRRRI